MMNIYTRVQWSPDFSNPRFFQTFQLIEASFAPFTKKLGEIYPQLLLEPPEFLNQFPFPKVVHIVAFHCTCTSE